jgi:hypothetical protein
LPALLWSYTIRIKEYLGLRGSGLRLSRDVNKITTRIYLEYLTRKHRFS